MNATKGTISKRVEEILNRRSRKALLLGDPNRETGGKSELVLGEFILAFASDSDVYIKLGI